jgi:hypothetical protein
MELYDNRVQKSTKKIFQGGLIPREPNSKLDGEIKKLKRSGI